MSTEPYVYVYVSGAPQRQWLYGGGEVVLTTLANAGISYDSTTIGVFPGGTWPISHHAGDKF